MKKIESGILSFCLLLLLVSCNNSSKETSSSKETVTTVQKSPEVIRIDEQSAKIDLNPQNSFSFCESKSKILGLEKFATTPESKTYVENKQKELLEILRRFADDIAEKEGKEYFSDNQLRENAYEEVKQKFRGMSIVSSVQQSNTKNTKNAMYSQVLVLLLTIKDAGGLFSSDKYYTVKTTTVAKSIIQCNASENSRTIATKIENLGRK